MAKFFIPTAGPVSWASLLAQPDLHWKEGRSAWLLAHSWETAAGFPTEVGQALATCGDSVLDGLFFVVGFPEFKTPLPGGARASQTDVLVLATNGAGQLVVIGVEGKVDEPFGPTVAEWLVGASEGKLVRLAYLCERLGLAPELASPLRYQLLHRTAAALIEAERLGAAAAVMVVQSFDRAAAGFDDYRLFTEAMGGTAEHGIPTRLSRCSSLPAYAGWVTSPTGTSS